MQMGRRSLGGINLVLGVMDGQLFRVEGWRSYTSSLVMIGKKKGVIRGG
jgi:hypothetical protein